MKPDVLLVGTMLPMVVSELDKTYRLHRHENPDDPAGLPAALRDAVRAVVTYGAVGVRRPVLEVLPKLEVVSCFGVGTDAIDVAHCRGRGVAVTNTPDVLTECVADMALALMLAVQRRIVAGDAYVRSGRWLAANMELTRRAGGRKVGVFGMGRIGQAVARRLLPFGCEVHYNGPNAKPALPYTYHARLVDMAAAVDVLILTSPGGAATRHAVDAAVLDALGPQGTLINVSRGSVVDEAALVAALTEGRLGQAGLDVFADEPKVPEALLRLDNVVLQPHAGSGTEETRADMGRLVLDNLAAHFAGRPLITPV